MIPARRDHAALAQAHLEKGSEPYDKDSNRSPEHEVKVAQVHAILALVDAIRRLDRTPTPTYPANGSSLLERDAANAV